MRPYAATLLLILTLTAGTGPTEAQGTDAFDLLQRVREAYAGRDAYHDEGEIEIVLEDGTIESWTFWTAGVRGGEFELALTPADGAASERVKLRRRGGVATRLDPGSVEARLLVDLGSGLRKALGPGSEIALVVPALVALGPEALPDPELLALDGEERCADLVCDLLVGAGGGLTWTLWVERERRLVRRVEVEIGASTLSPGRRIRVAHRPRSPSLPPIQALRSAGAQTPGRPEIPVFSDSVVVALTTLELRVVDRTGAAVTELDADDFRLFVGADEVPIESADWTDPAQPLGPDAPLEELAAAGIEPPTPGQLVVVFVQADLRPSRLSGQIRMLPRARRLIDDLGPDDRIAVVSFDSHLKLRQDFTRDRERLDRALETAIRPAPAPFPRAGSEPSLARHLDPRQAAKAASPERALELLALALAEFDQPKLVVYLGWGLGLSNTRAGAFSAAVSALDRAAATVFVLDVTEAGFHTLEAGLRSIADATGGTYAKTHEFPTAVTDRLTRTVAGQYVIAFRPPSAPPGTRIRVELRDPARGEVLIPNYVTGP
jgi:VWFA-related protein